MGNDLAKRVYQLHRAREDCSEVFNKKLSRSLVLSFFAQQPRCIVATAACATSHGWRRELEKFGHKARLISPVYVKPFLKRHKNDAADAEVIIEAASRPNMRFVAVKTEYPQARAMLFRTRQMTSFPKRVDCLNQKNVEQADIRADFSKAEGLQRVSKRSESNCSEFSFCKPAIQDRSPLWILADPPWHTDVVGERLHHQSRCII